MSSADKDFPSGHDVAARRAWTPRLAPRMDGFRRSEIRELLKLIDQDGVISFAGGVPDTSLFPLDKVRQACDGLLSDPIKGLRSLQYGISEGDPDLRDWIADRMRRRGVTCSRDNVLVTSGSQQALEFLGRLLVSPGDGVLVTTPTYLGAMQAFASGQPRYGAMALSGGCAEARPMGDGTLGRTALLYLVPDHANPTGQTLTEAERRAVLDLAEALDAPVVEDGAYADLGFSGQQPRSMLALDSDRNGGIDASRVIYCGTFSKVFAPGLRIGWVCASRPIVEHLVMIKQASDLNVPWLNQRIALDLAGDGFDRQAARAQRLYAEKCDAMLDALAQAMPDGSRWSRPDGGMFVWLELPGQIDTAALLPRAIRDHGVAYVPGAAFFADRRRSSALRLSYSLPSPSRIAEGVARLGACLSRGA